MDFVDGCLVAAWDQVAQMIVNNRDVPFNRKDLNRWKTMQMMPAVNLAGTMKFKMTAQTVWFAGRRISLRGQKFERQRHPGSAKLPPCAMALLTIQIDGGEKGPSVVTHRLYLHTRTEGLLCAFFESIGQRKHGEALRPRWNRSERQPWPLPRRHPRIHQQIRR